mmetsp:Transcript_27725/g.35849  ORF Transcript_27725/g.35849 Transcript_27725/m.35849 type:complete len:627 (-) Transcript_27725:265-2145(-)
MEMHQEELSSASLKTSLRKLEHSHAKDLVRQLKASGWFDSNGNPPDTKEFSLIGLLMKRRSGFGRHIGQRWVNRCFALKDGRLVYFESDTLASVDWSNPRGVLDLTDPGVTYIVNRSFENAPSSHTLQINVASVKYPMRWKLCAFTAKELESWIQEIGKYCQLHEGGRTNGSIPDDYEINPAEFSLDSPKEPPSSPHNPSEKPSDDTAVRSELSDGEISASQISTIKEGVPTDQNTEGKKVGQRKRFKKTPQPNGMLGTSPSMEIILVLSFVNGIMFLIYTLEGWMLWGLIFSLNALTFQVLLNSRKVDQWAENDLCSRASIDFVGSSGVCGSTVAISDAVNESLDLPYAGESMLQAKDLTDEQRCSEEPIQTMQHSWANGFGPHFSIRSKGYSKHKKKTASGKSLYNCVAMDFFKVEARVNHIAADYKMPSSSFDFNHEHVPQFFVINVQMPGEAPSMMNAVTDGPGYQVVLYFEIDSSTAEDLKQQQPDQMNEGTRLLLEYCRKAEVDPKFRGRFKVIGLLRNPNELNLPNFITKHNGKPVLINKSGRLFRGPKYLEMDINVHNFSFIAKKGLYYMQDKFPNAYLNVGFVIEGRNDIELPERMLGCCQVNQPDISKATNLDIFA